MLTDAPLVARTQGDAPEVDGRVLLDAPAPVGEFIDVEVTARRSTTWWRGGWKGYAGARTHLTNVFFTRRDINRYEVHSSVPAV